MLRVAIIGSPAKPNAGATLDRTRDWIGNRAEVVFAELTYESWRALPHKPDLLFVLGGDGTLITAVHGMGQQQVPVLGINLGKLGYLAEFTIEQLERDGDFLFRSNFPITRRIMLDVAIYDAEQGATSHRPAINDCVILAGPPFHLIGLTVLADGQEVANFRGDGVIVATASGSTAHNLSAGGPILEPTAEAMVLTPLAPHSLTFRPLVLDAERRVEVLVREANTGTTLVVDGREQYPFRLRDRVTITRFAADALLVRNPQRSVWHALRQKLGWGRNPQR